MRIDAQIANLYQSERLTPEAIASELNIPLMDVYDITDLCQMAEKDAETEDGFA